MEIVLPRFSIRRALKTDFHVRFTLLYRVWLIVAGGVSVLGIPFWFNGVEQGYFYTFSSLIAAQVLFELGTAFVITQLTAHEMGRAKEGEEPANQRIAEILAFSNTWFLYAALLFVLLIGLSGAIFFWQTGHLEPSEWLIPWLLLVVVNAFNVRQMSQLSLLEGAGQFGQVARLRFAQSLAGNLIMWALLFSGAKLWALPILPIVMVLMTTFWLKKHPFIQSLHESLAKGAPNSIQWKRDILPMQWRIALSWASGYFIFQALTPIVFAKLGPVTAGQIGLGLAIFNGVQSVGMSWMYTKTARYAELVVSGERDLLNVTFLHALKRSVSMVALGVVSVWIAFAAMDACGWSILNRLPALEVLVCLGLVTLINSVIFSVALYMRSHKEEPMLLASIVGGVLTLAGVYVGASYSAFAVALIYLLATLLVGLPWSLILFRSYFYRVA